MRRARKQAAFVYNMRVRRRPRAGCPHPRGGYTPGPSRSSPAPHPPPCLRPAPRKTVGSVEGAILVNGRPKQQASWARVLGWGPPRRAAAPPSAPAPWLRGLAWGCAVWGGMNQGLRRRPALAVPLTAGTASSTTSTVRA